MNTLAILWYTALTRCDLSLVIVLSLYINLDDKDASLPGVRGEQMLLFSLIQCAESKLINTDKTIKCLNAAEDCQFNVF